MWYRKVSGLSHIKIQARRLNMSYTFSFAFMIFFMMMGQTFLLYAQDSSDESSPVTFNPMQHHQDDEHHHHNTASKKIKLKPQVKLLYQLDQEILQLIQQQRTVQSKIQKQKQKIQQLDQKLVKLAQKIKIQREALSRALILRKKLKSARIAEVFLSANGPGALKRREVYLHSIFQADTQQLLALNQEKKQVKRYRSEMKTLYQDVQVLQKELDQKAQVLSQRRNDEWQLLSQVYGVKPLHNSVKNRLVSLRLPPVKGKWIDHFHKFRGIKRAKLWGEGIWIQSQKAAPVYSVEAGIVLFAQKVKNWKSIVMIQHDAMMMSIYAGMERIHVRTGQKVAIQEFIGSVGEMNTQTRLYFELRKAGIAIHPKRWIEEK